MISTKLRDSVSEAGKMLGQSIKKSMPTYIIYATVESVDEQAMTIDAVVDGDQVFSDIDLNVFPNSGNSITLIPAIESLVVLGFIEGFAEQPFIIRPTKVDKIIIRNENQTESEIIITNDSISIKREESIWQIEGNKISLSSELIELNGGNNNGLIFVDELTSSLNDLVREINNAIQVFNPHTHNIQITGTAGPYPVTATGTITPPTSNMSNTSEFDKANYENTKITQ